MSKTLDYTRLTSPKQFEIRYALRRKHFLVMFTNFNPFCHKAFAETFLAGSMYCEVMNVYDDGTGYYIFRLPERYDPETLMCEIQEAFQNYFEL